MGVLPVCKSRLPLVGEITYNRGNEEFVGGRGNLRGKGCKIGEMLENVRELIRNCLIENRIKIKINFTAQSYRTSSKWEQVAANANTCYSKLCSV